MKKWLKILIIVAAVILIAVTSLAVWQWKNIRSIFIGVSESETEIAKRRNDNQTQLVDNVNDYLDKGVRDFTEEEKAKIDSGEVKAEEVYKEIFEEEYQQSQDKNESKETSEQKVELPKPTKDEIILKYMNQLYGLQSKYTAKAEVTISSGRNYYINLRKTQDGPTARANTISHYTPIVRGVESSCDAEVNTLIANLEKELKAIGENTDITGTIRSAYATEKQLKLSYYANKYLK